MQRIAIIGSGGAGKSVLARELGQRLGIPVLHLDRLYWHPSWIPTPTDDWRALQQEFVQSERWIIDGNYGGTMDVRLAAADTVVFLDLPRLVCVWGALTRYLRHRRGGRPDMAPGINERLDLAFLWWIWRYPATRRPGILARLSELPASTRVVRITSRREARAFLDAARSEAAG